MRTKQSRRLACAFESLEGKALMAAYLKFDGIEGEVSPARHQVAEVHIAQPPAPPRLPAVQAARESGR
jgi:hypothetical protein